jgi:hypothetical protein
MREPDARPATAIVPAPALSLGTAQDRRHVVARGFRRLEQLAPRP